MQPFTSNAIFYAKELFEVELAITIHVLGKSLDWIEPPISSRVLTADLRELEGVHADAVHHEASSASAVGRTSEP